MIEHLKNKVTTFLQVKKINEIIDSLIRFDETISGSAIQDLINQYNSRLENMKHYLNDKVTESIDDLKNLVDSTLANYYTKDECNNRFVKLSEVDDFIRYNNPEINGKLVINSGNNPCINFTQGSISTLFNIDEYSIEAFPFAIKRGDKTLLEFNAYGLVTNKTIITTNNYRNYVKLPQWRSDQEMNKENFSIWSEAYSYRADGWEYQPIFLLVHDAFKRGYSPWNNPNEGVSTDMSLSFFNYYAWAQNHTIATRLELDPTTYKFQLRWIYRQRRKHHGDYSHKWWGLGGYVTKWR